MDGNKINNKNMNLSKYIKEAFDAGTEPLSKEQKKAFMESIAKYNQFKESLYRSADLREMAKNISELVQMAESVALTENDDWFDNVTIQRNVKSLRQNVKEFNKTANEVQLQQQRLEALYEDIGSTLNRYFDINEINASSPETAPVNEDDARDRRKSQSVMGSGKSNVVQKIFDKFIKLPGVTEKRSKQSSLATEFTYSYGIGRLTIVGEREYDEPDMRPVIAMFEEDRIHDFLVHMNKKGFGSNIFNTLKNLGTQSMKGYTTIVNFE